MTKQFKDYPADLQRIVELTPEGWEEGYRSVSPPKGGDCVFWRFSASYGKYTRTEYDQCRAAYLHETAGDIKAGEVDWRALCEELVCNLQQMTDDYGYTSYCSEQEKQSEPEVIAAYSAIDKARAALEASK